MNHPAELARGIVMPVQVYPMFETAIRAAAGETRRRSTRSKISELWARFSAVAAANPNAWIRDATVGRGDPHATAAEPDDRLARTRST